MSKQGPLKDRVSSHKSGLADEIHRLLQPPQMDEIHRLLQSLQQMEEHHKQLLQPLQQMEEHHKQLLQPLQQMEKLLPAHAEPKLNEFFAVQRKPSQNGFPRVDVYEHDTKFVVEFSMAGVAPEDVKIEIEDQHPHNRDYAEYGKLLRVSGKMATAFEHKKDATYHVKELTRKHFVRSMLLPQYVKDDPKATYNNGMLTLVFDTDKTPVEEKPRSKVIQITNNAGHRLDFTDRDGEVGGK